MAATVGDTGAGAAGAAAAPPAYWNRWVTLAAGMCAMLCSGPIFTFGAIHTDTKRLLGATELQVQLIGVAGDVGLWLKIVPGVVFDLCGARATMSIGALLAASGYLGFYAAVAGGWAAEVAALFWFLAGTGSGFLYTAALFPSVKNFAPHQRGFVTGVLACMFGTSAAVFSSLLGGCLGGSIVDKRCVGGALGGSLLSYVAVLATVVPIVGLLAAVATRQMDISVAMPGRGDRAKLRFVLLFVGCTFLIVVVFGMKLLAAFADRSVNTWGNFVWLVLLAPVLALPAGAGPAQLAEASPEEGRGGVPAAPRLDARQRLASAMTLLKQPRFWSLFFAFGVTVGADLMTLNILSSIVVSREMEREKGGLLVVMQMGADTMARICAGAAVWMGVAPLTKLLVAAPVLTVIAQVFLGLGGNLFLQLAVVLLGLSDGMMWMATPLFVGQAYGLDKVGVNFGLTVLSAAIFQSLFSLALEPHVYSKHLVPGTEVCLGKECFADTHWAVAVLAGCAVFAALHVHVRSRARDMAQQKREAQVSETESFDTENSVDGRQ